MLPISRNQAHKVARWMKSNFATEINQAVAGTPFTINHVCAIACQETAFMWVGWINTKSVEDILRLCVGDASGDYPGTQRSAFPRNTAVFRARFGEDLTNMLIGEANKSRAARNLGPKQWVYKGYGIHQYDLQHILTNPSFFREKKWYRYADCLAKLMKELKEKYAVHQNLWKAIKAYNGRGTAATNYANNVIQFTDYCSEV